MRAAMARRNKDAADVAQLTSPTLSAPVEWGHRSGAEAGSMDEVHRVRTTSDGLATYRKSIGPPRRRSPRPHDIHTNSAEGFISVFKRGMRGICQHCEKKHLHHYRAEFDFLHNHRIAGGANDTMHVDAALLGNECCRSGCPSRSPLDGRRSRPACPDVARATKMTPRHPLPQGPSLGGLDLQLTLEAFGYRVLGPASSNQEVLAMLAHERRPDVAVVDLHLTDGLSTPVTEALSALGIPFMLLTGSDDDDAALPGSVPQLGKPYAPDALERTVRQLLDRSNSAFAGSSPQPGGWEKQHPAEAGCR
jgi:CheY-like chemotaxis protein